MRTARRSKTYAYGCLRQTLRYLLRSLGVDSAQCKLVSLALRAAYLEMARSDLTFVRQVDPAALASDTIRSVTLDLPVPATPVRKMLPPAVLAV